MSDHTSALPGPDFLAASCDRCGVAMTPEVRDFDNSWGYVAADDTRICPATVAPVEWGDPTWWADVRARVAAGDADLGAHYSALTAALTLCWHPYNRPHRPSATWTQVSVPDCCDWPMRWTPTGWECREDGYERRTRELVSR